MIIELIIKRRHIPLQVQPSGNLPSLESLPSFEVDSKDVVSAFAKIGNGEQDDYYILQMGNNPDIRAVKDFGDKDFFTWDDGNKKVSFFRLFQGTVGTSCLFLINEQGYVNPLAEVTVINEDKEHLYDAMAADLLGQGLPHFVVDDFKWQMYRNKFSLDWHHGYASYESVDVMLRALAKIIKRITPLLLFINNSPIMRYERRFQWRCISKLSHISPHLSKSIGSLMGRNCVNSIDEMPETLVCTSTKWSSCRAPAHSAILTFLENFVQRRLGIIGIELNDRLPTKTKKHKSLRNKYTVNMYAEEKSKLDSIKRKIALQEKLSAKVREFLSYPFLSGARDDVSIYDVDCDDFSFNEGYQQLYKLILDYSRTSFWWVGDRSNSIWKMPKMNLAENGETRLQQKYSIVYENWCYAKLIEAMLAMGFECKEGHHIKNTNGSSIHFKKGATEILIIHGIIAPRKKKGTRVDEEEFVYCGRDDSDKKTPDFAIVITLGSFYSWIVADAKSDARPNSGMAKKRDEYCDIKRYGKDPLASLLLISCDDKREGMNPSIEIPSLNPTVPNMPSFRAGLLANGESNESAPHIPDYVWLDGYGIVEGDNDTAPYKGNLKVNVQSLKHDPLFFQRFFIGIIATVSRMKEATSESQ